MVWVMQPQGGESPDPSTLQLIADYHAGLLTDEDAAAVRRRVAADPDAARALTALESARQDVTALGSTPAEEPPAEATERVTAALRAESEHVVTGAGRTAAHADRPRRAVNRLRTVGVMAGLVAVALAVGVGAVALWRLPPSAPASTGPSAKYITVPPPAPDMPLTDSQILGLLDTAPDYGPLADGQRRASCLNGLGYPADETILGATPVTADGVAGVLLVLPAERTTEIVAVVVPPTCSAVDTGLVVDTVIPRP